jgi:hypothetical protein
VSKKKKKKSKTGFEQHFEKKEHQKLWQAIHFNRKRTNFQIQNCN